jgi:hypothetical protein
MIYTCIFQRKNCKRRNAYWWLSTSFLEDNNYKDTITDIWTTWKTKKTRISTHSRMVGLWKICNKGDIKIMFPKKELSFPISI